MYTKGAESLILPFSSLYCLYLVGHEGRKHCKVSNNAKNNEDAVGADEKVIHIVIKSKSRQLKITDDPFSSYSE